MANGSLTTLDHTALRTLARFRSARLLPAWFDKTEPRPGKFNRQRQEKHPTGLLSDYGYLWVPLNQLA